MIYGPIWAHMGPIWAHMGSYGPIRAHIPPCVKHKLVNEKWKGVISEKYKRKSALLTRTWPHLPGGSTYSSVGLHIGLHIGPPHGPLGIHGFWDIVFIFFVFSGFLVRLCVFWPRGGRNRVDASEICRNQSLFCQTEPSGPET